MMYIMIIYKIGVESRSGNHNCLIIVPSGNDLLTCGSNQDGVFLPVSIALHDELRGKDVHIEQSSPLARDRLVVGNP
jgi:hypothetical protein